MEGGWPWGEKENVGGVGGVCPKLSEKTTP